MAYKPVARFQEIPRDAALESYSRGFPSSHACCGAWCASAGTPQRVLQRAGGTLHRQSLAGRHNHGIQAGGSISSVRRPLYILAGLRQGQAFSCCRVHMCRLRVPGCELGDGSTRRYPLTSPVCVRRGGGTTPNPGNGFCSANGGEPKRENERSYPGYSFSSRRFFRKLTRCMSGVYQPQQFCPPIGNFPIWHPPPRARRKGLYLCPA
jgi:hypothetical protein